MTLRDDIKTRLQADTTLAALATGGVLVDQPSPAVTPDAFAVPLGGRDPRLLPCVVVDESTRQGEGPFETSELIYIHILCYAPTGRECEALMDAAYEVLDGGHDQFISGYLVRWFDDTRRAVPDEAYRPPELYMRSRYTARGLRKDW